MAGIRAFYNFSLAILITVLIDRTLSSTSTTTGNPVTSTTPGDPAANDLTLEASKGTIGYGIDKDFDVECMYNRSDKSDKSGVMAIVLEHKPEGKTQFEDLASIIINFFNPSSDPTKVQEYKQLGDAVVTGLLTKTGMEESYIKYSWIYPQSEVLGEYKCTVRTMTAFGDSNMIEKTVTVSDSSVTLPEVVERIVNVDLNLDDVREDIKRLGNKNNNFRAEYEYLGMTYMMSRKYWTNHLAAQSVCQHYGASLLEINDADEWTAIKKFLAAETGPFLIGANNKQHNSYWYNMNNKELAMIASLINWSPSASTGNNRHCMVLTRMTDAEQWQMDTVQCEGMTYKAYICKFEPIVNNRV